MKIIIALDDSPYSHHVMDVVCRRHWPQDCEFKLLHILPPLEFSDWANDDWPAMQSEIRKSREQHAERLCADARHRLERHFPSARVHFEIRHGNPKTEIVRAATDWEANRVLLGAHGHSVCPHNLMGSVSRSVAELAPCSVEIVRQKPHVKSSEADKSAVETPASR